MFAFNFVNLNLRYASSGMLPWRAFSRELITTAGMCSIIQSLFSGLFLRRYSATNWIGYCGLSLAHSDMA